MEKAAENLSESQTTVGHLLHRPHALLLGHRLPGGWITQAQRLTQKEVLQGGGGGGGGGAPSFSSLGQRTVLRKVLNLQGDGGEARPDGLRRLHKGPLAVYSRVRLTARKLPSRRRWARAGKRAARAGRSPGLEKNVLTAEARRGAEVGEGETKALQTVIVLSSGKTGADGSQRNDATAEDDAQRGAHLAQRQRLQPLQGPAGAALPIDAILQRRQQPAKGDASDEAVADAGEGQRAQAAEEGDTRGPGPGTGGSPRRQVLQLQRQVAETAELQRLAQAERQVGGPEADGVDRRQLRQVDCLRKAVAAVVVLAPTVVTTINIRVALRRENERQTAEGGGHGGRERPREEGGDAGAVLGYAGEVGRAKDKLQVNSRGIDPRGHREGGGGDCVIAASTQASVLEQLQLPLGVILRPDLLALIVPRVGVDHQAAEQRQPLHRGATVLEVGLVEGPADERRRAQHLGQRQVLEDEADHVDGQVGDLGGGGGGGDGFIEVVKVVEEGIEEGIEVGGGVGRRKATRIEAVLRVKD
ncbi:hypothetical protein TYRP_010426 [Tyrophagus putrescentiae]|nr:hypothetical protein TYRP_010426 [Tyrophagus putrescentiae]